MSNKPRVFKSYEKLEESIIEQLKLEYPFGFDKKLVLIPGPGGKLLSVLPFETEDRYYLIKMSREEAHQIIVDDDDYNESGNLKKSVKEAYEMKYDDDLDDDDEDEDDDLDLEELDIDESLDD